MGNNQNHNKKMMNYIIANFEIKKREAEKLSKFHTPPKHAKKHVIAMLHTPSGKTAFDNEVFYPKKREKNIDIFINGIKEIHLIIILLDLMIYQEE